MPKRACKAKTKRGTKCQAHPLKPGTVIDGVTVKGGHCRKHDPDLSSSAQLAGPHPGSGRPRLPRPSEVAQQLIERNILVLQRPYWRALGYDVVIGKDGPELVELEGGGAKIYGESKDGDINMTMHDDLEAHQKAAERLQDRVYGRPKQATEITSPDGGAIVLVAPPDATEKSRKAAELLKSLGRVDASS